MVREQALDLAMMFTRIMRGVIEGWPKGKGPLA
jgi:hypothetical protein